MRPKRSVSPTVPTCFSRAKSFSKAPAKNYRTTPLCVKNTSAATSSSAAKNSIKIPTHISKKHECTSSCDAHSLYFCPTLWLLFRFWGKILGIEYALLPNREWNQKNKNIKNSLGATRNASHLSVRLCALRHWKRVSMPPTTQSLRHPLTRAFHVAPRIKTARRFTAKNP